MYLYARVGFELVCEPAHGIVPAYNCDTGERFDCRPCTKICSQKYDGDRSMVVMVVMVVALLMVAIIPCTFANKL